MIEVTKCDYHEVKFKPLSEDKGLIGFASCILNDCLYLGSIGIFKRLDNQGFRLVFPVRTSEKGMKFNIFFPINNRMYNVLLDAVIKEMNKTI